jgi:hypothetical protein
MLCYQEFTMTAVVYHAWKAGHVASDDAWRRVKPFRGVETARSTATRAIVGTNSRSSSSRLAVNSALIKLIPVRFPPGRASWLLSWPPTPKGCLR